MDCEENSLMSLYYFDMLFLHMKPNKCKHNVESPVGGLLECVLSNDTHVVADCELVYCVRYLEFILEGGDEASSCVLVR